MSDIFAIPSSPIAVVGVGAIMPRRPRRRCVLGEHHRRSLLDHRGPARALGSGAVLLARSRRSRTRPTRRSAAGCATTRGTRSAGSCRFRRRSPTRWTTVSGGRSAPPGPRSLDAGWPDWNDRSRQRRRGHRQRDRRREALRDEHAHRAARGAARPGERRVVRRADRRPARSTSSTRRASTSSRTTARSTRTRCRASSPT